MSEKKKPQRYESRSGAHAHVRLETLSAVHPSPAKAEEERSSEHQQRAALVEKLIEFIKGI